LKNFPYKPVGTQKRRAKMKMKGDLDPVKGPAKKWPLKTDSGKVEPRVKQKLGLTGSEDGRESAAYWPEISRAKKVGRFMDGGRRQGLLFLRAAVVWARKGGRTGKHSTMVVATET